MIAAHLISLFVALLIWFTLHCAATALFKWHDNDQAQRHGEEKL